MIILLIFFALLLIGIPIFMVLGISGISYIFASGNLPLLETAPQRLFSANINFSLLAIPLFILAGELMNHGGITKRLIKFAQVLVGHFRGGLAYVNVVTNTFLASILGSSLAQTAMMSRIMVPAMEKEGYKREFSTATTAAAAMMGPIIPPSMTFIIYSVIAETSIGTMFLAGIVPGTLMGISFVGLIAYFGYTMSFPKTERSSFSEIITAFVQVFPALSVPIVIVGGIILGIFTATESAAFACLIALIAGLVFYRELKIKELPKVFLEAGVTTAIVTILISMAKLFGLTLTFERIPQMITEWMVSVTDNPLFFLLLINVFLLLVGMVMDGIAALIILAPILIPAAVTYDINLIHFGVLFCINIVIGSLTPPVGSGLFVAASTAEVKIEKLVRSLAPFLVAVVIVLLIVTYFPELIMFIPNLAK